MTESNDETNKSQAKNTSIIKESINTQMSQKLPRLRVFGNNW